MPYPEDFCEISGKSVRRKIVKFDDFRIRDPTLLSGVLLRRLHVRFISFSGKSVWGRAGSAERDQDHQDLEAVGDGRF